MKTHFPTSLLLIKWVAREDEGGDNNILGKVYVCSITRALKLSEYLSRL
jgi:hypothetical protein